MTTSTVIASGVTTTAAGAGGALTGDAAGLDGLFAALMGSMDAGTATPLAGTAPVPMAEGMISVLLGVKTTPAGVGERIPLDSLTQIFAAQPPASEDVQLGDGPVLTVSGDAKTLSAFVQKLKDIYQKVVVEGGLTIGELSNSQELAGALTKLGMSEEEAMGVAERIQTMLKILDQQQDVDDETAGSLVAMMLAVMGQQVVVPADAGAAGETAETPAFGLQIMSMEQTPVKTATMQGTMTTWQMRASSDVTRDLLGLGGAQDATVKADAGAGKDAAGDKARKLELSLTTDGDAAIAVAMPDLKDVPMPGRMHVPVPVASDAQPSVAAQTASAVTTTGTAVKVMADERIEAPKGDTYYRLQADKNGVETLDAVKPMSEVRESAVLTTPATPATVVTADAAAAATAATGAGFAERVAQIQDMVEKAGVGKQVAVQMQPLLDQGGGTVRINLNPKELGRITVELTVVDGKVSGAIAASDPAVVEQLARELHSLRHGLADAGLKVGEQGINLMLSNSNHQGQQGQQNPQGQQTAHTGNGRGGMAADGGTDEAATELATSIAGWVSPDRVLDVNV